MMSDWVKYNKEDKFVPTTIENFDYKITNRCGVNNPMTEVMGL